MNSYCSAHQANSWNRRGRKFAQVAVGALDECRSRQQDRLTY